MIKTRLTTINVSGVNHDVKKSVFLNYLSVAEKIFSNPTLKPSLKKKRKNLFEF